MLLRDLLVKVSILKLIGSTDIKISDLQFDSRLVKNDDIFFAIKGNKINIDKIFEKGKNINKKLSQEGFNPNTMRALKLEGNGIRFLSAQLIEGPAVGVLAALRDRMVR